jgi:DNA-binding protein HU-beta
VLVGKKVEELQKVVDFAYYILPNYQSFLKLLTGVFSMNKAELIEAVAVRSNTTKAQTATMLDGLLEVIQKTLTGGNNVQLVGFGTFSITERAGRAGRNPATGESMTIPAKKVVRFKPGKILADSAAAVKPVRASKASKPKQAGKKK